MHGWGPLAGLGCWPGSLTSVMLMLVYLACVIFTCSFCVVGSHFLGSLLLSVTNSGSCRNDYQNRVRGESNVGYL